MRELLEVRASSEGGRVKERGRWCMAGNVEERERLSDDIRHTATSYAYDATTAAVVAAEGRQRSR
jgi:hypothetical protein